MKPVRPDLEILILKSGVQVPKDSSAPRVGDIYHIGEAVDFDFIADFSSGVSRVVFGNLEAVVEEGVHAEIVFGTVVFFVVGCLQKRFKSVHLIFSNVKQIFSTDCSPWEAYEILIE